MTTRGNERLAWIDSLRGLAALLVVYSHCPLFGREGQMILDVSGQLGVDVFFIISGYVVPSSISANHAHPLRVFAIRRFWRLYPLYWLSIPFGLLVLPSVPSTAAIVANVTMAQRYLGASDIISVYWTLSIELLFYGLTAAAWGLGWLSRPDAITRALLILMGLVVAGAMAARGEIFRFRRVR